MLNIKLYQECDEIRIGQGKKIYVGGYGDGNLMETDKKRKNIYYVGCAPLDIMKGKRKIEQPCCCEGSQVIALAGSYEKFSTMNYK